MTVDEVAELLKLNPQTVRNWINDGLMPAVRIGRRIRITRADLERVIQQGYSPAATAPPDEDVTAAQRLWDGEEHAAPEPPGG